MKVSHYPQAVVRTDADRKGAVVSLNATVNHIRSGEKGLAHNTHTLRQMLAKGDTERYRQRKAQILPAATFSGIFSIRDRNIALPDKFTQHSGLLSYDIDDVKRSDMRAIKIILSLQPNIILVFDSPSYEGLKAFERVSPIPTTANDAEHKHAWQTRKALLDEKLGIYGYKCDSGDDPTRLCFLAHDPDVYYDPSKTAAHWDIEAFHQAQALEKEREQEQLRISKKNNRKALESRNWDNSEIDKSALSFIDPDIDYDDWFRVVAVCKSVGFTWQEVDTWCRGGAKYREGDIEKRWNGIPGTGKATWGTVVYFAQQSGYQLPRGKRQPKLQRTPTDEPLPTQKITENQVKLEASTDTFMTDEPEEDELHILIIQEPTGMGKSNTILAKSNQHGKRTIANTPHNELAEQAVDTAYKQGYTNPFHLIGREHNWENSGIAGIPIKMRTAELFEKNNCIMVDEVKRYTEKRIAPRTFCQHKCPFKEECPHLAQYKGLGERDFIASCTPNLLFDLNMRGYLQLLVTATNEPDDEDLAIDAILGTESQETTEFDFAILDDYSIAALYTDITFTQSDFQALQKAWKGTPTGDFAKEILKAFEKKKPHKIVKALRKAFEKTAEHHTEIAKSLTQHARVGVIEQSRNPKASAETQSVLSEKELKYADGGRHFIPVDNEAYKELQSKGIHSVNPDLLDTQEIGETVRIPHAPTQALQSGIQLKDLTPLWQKGATPIELLGIFLKSLGNDKNAPISRTFRNGDPPIAILTFSIPPQAPVGILPQIAMLSATTDIDDTQRAFDGQAVSFSKHTGSILEWADDVKVYQFTDARLTSGSIFEHPKDADGKRLLQEAPIGLTPTAEKRIAKLNDWAKSIDGITAFISYKEFTENFTETVNNFDIVTHFDKVTGLNFDGLKFLVVFGYPKVKHEIIIEHARRQHRSDHEPLPKGTYDELTETANYQENRITVTERRYKDPRLEKIRHQLSTEKLEQATGRARFPRWTDTTTLIFTNAPISSTSTRATLFSAPAFNLAEAPSDIENATTRINEAEATGDVKAIMETQGVGEWTARKRSQSTRKQRDLERDTRILELHAAGKSQRETEHIMKSEGYKVSNGTIRNVLKAPRKNGEDLLVYTYRQSPNLRAQENVDEPCVESKSSENTNGSKLHIPQLEYSQLTENEARAELQYCEDNNNYNDAAYLRRLFRDKGWQHP